MNEQNPTSLGLLRARLDQLLNDPQAQPEQARGVWRACHDCATRLMALPFDDDTITAMGAVEGIKDLAREIEDHLAAHPRPAALTS